MNTSSSFKQIGVFCSGGDSPGMNAAVRAVVRTACLNNLTVVGVRHGYQGLLTRDVVPLPISSVANIIQRGGTILKSGRCPDFHKIEVRAKAHKVIQSLGLDGLVCIGGDGSFRGAHALFQEHGVPIVGLPGTIDNDLWGTDFTIGFDTAVNTALDAIDRIRDTADAHDRIFIVEVMGRNSGYIAIDVALAGGAEEVFIPEHPQPVERAIEHIKRGMARGKSSHILITAEGQKPGRAYDLAEALRKKAGWDAKVCILGHVQRGGAPTAFDRVLASRLGSQAVQSLLNREWDIMLGVLAGKVSATPLTDAFEKKKRIPRELIELTQTLS